MRVDEMMRTSCKEYGIEVGLMSMYGGERGCLHSRCCLSEPPRVRRLPSDTAAARPTRQRALPTGPAESLPADPRPGGNTAPFDCRATRPGRPRCAFRREASRRL